MNQLHVERCLPDGFLAGALRADARAGLTAVPKTLPPKWFYDERGSELFEKITLLPEYYPTRAERSILAAVAPEIAAATGASALVELGSGSQEKTGLLSSTRCAGRARCAATYRWTSARAPWSGPRTGSWPATRD